MGGGRTVSVPWGVTWGDGGGTWDGGDGDICTKPTGENRATGGGDDSVSAMGGETGGSGDMGWGGGISAQSPLVKTEPLGEGGEHWADRGMEWGTGDSDGMWGHWQDRGWSCWEDVRMRGTWGWGGRRDTGRI